MHIYILANLWKNKAVIERLKDGTLQLSNISKIPKEILKAADTFFEDIDQYLKAVDDMNNVDKTIHKMMIVFGGWGENEKIKKFMNEDEEALNLFIEYQAKLNSNGWHDIYSDYREYETKETELMKVEIFKRATSFSKSSK